MSQVNGVFHFHYPTVLAIEFIMEPIHLVVCK